MIKEECLQTIEKTIEMIPAANRAKSSPAQTAFSLREGIDGKQKKGGVDVGFE